MDGWLGGLVAAKMEEIILNFTKNLMITERSNYNIKTHQTGEDGESMGPELLSKTGK